MEAHATAAAENEREELARKVAEATAEQLKAQIQADMAVLKQRIPDAAAKASEAAMDVKYVKDRQRCLQWSAQPANCMPSVLNA